MRSTAPTSDLPTLVAICRDWLWAVAAHLARFAPDARAFAQYDYWLRALILGVALRGYRLARRRARRQFYRCAAGFTPRIKIRNSGLRFWTHGVLPKRARDGAGALARFISILRNIDVYAARVFKRLKRGACVRVVAIAPPARLLHGGVDAVDAISVNSS